MPLEMPLFPDQLNDDENSPLGSDEVRAEIATRFKYCDDFYIDWHLEAKQDYRFALGDQWSDEEKTQLHAEGRPCLTFNKIRPIINVVTGYQREHSSRIKCSPEGQEDKIFSEFCDKLMHFIDKRGNLNYNMGYWFDDGCVCGKSFLEAVITYDSDPVRGEIKFQLESPWHVMTDPDYKGYDLNDGCRYLFKIRKYPKGVLKELFPKKKDIIDGFKMDTDDYTVNISEVVLEHIKGDYGNKARADIYATTRGEDVENERLAKDQKFTLKEYWRPKMIQKYFVIDEQSGEPKKFDNKEDAESFAKSQGSGYEVVPRMVKEMWVADMCCGIILQDIKSPFEPYYSGFPFFRFLGDWSPNGTTERYRVQGLTRALKDPQREKNKSRSQQLHILNTQANSGWIGDEDALSDEGWRKLEKMGSKPGLTVKKKAGKELREILPKGPNQGHLIREETADQEFKTISGINPDLLAQQDASLSGRAMMIRIQQGIISLARIFGNYRFSKEILGDFMLQIVPMVFDAKKAIKVVGTDFMKNAIDEKHPQGINEGNIQAYMYLIKENKYEVYVSEADENATLRTETLMQLTDLMKAGLPIPPDLLLSYMDIPNMEEVQAKVDAYMKQQQQMQMLMAQAGIKSKAAKKSSKGRQPVSQQP